MTISGAQAFVKARHRHAYDGQRSDCRWYVGTEVGGWIIETGSTREEAWKKAEWALRKLEAEQKADTHGPAPRPLLKPCRHESGAYW